MNKQNLIILSLSVMFLITISFVVHSSWSEPEGNMPGTYNPPINTGGETQSKTGEIAHLFLEIP